MRKVLLSFLIGCMGLIPGNASTIINLDGKTPPPPDMPPVVRGDLGDLTGGRPLVRTLYQSFYTFEYNSFSSTLSIRCIGSCPYEPGSFGSLFVSVANIFTGEIYIYYFDDFIGETVIPFAGESGIWRLCLSTDPVLHNPTILYRSLFTIENGMIMEL